jgi:hypothetical protein
MSAPPTSRGGPVERPSRLGQAPLSVSDLEEAISSEPGPRLRAQSAARRIGRSGSHSSGLSSSVGHRQPTRSFFHHASHGNIGKIFQHTYGFSILIFL